MSRIQIGLYGYMKLKLCLGGEFRFRFYLQFEIEMRHRFPTEHRPHWTNGFPFQSWSSGVFPQPVQLPPLHVSHRVASLAQGGQLCSRWLVSAECRVPAAMSPKPSLVSATGDKRSQRPRKVYMGFHSENGMLQCKSTDMEQCEEIRFRDHGIGCLSVGPGSNAPGGVDTKWLWIDLLDVELFIWKVKKHLSMKGATQSTVPFQPSLV